MSKEKWIDLEFKYSEDTKKMTITLTSEHSMSDDDVFVALQYYINNFSSVSHQEEDEETYH